MTAQSAACWRVLCLTSVLIVVVLTAAVLVKGILRGESALRAALIPWATPAVTEAARWVSNAGTWRVLVPAAVILFAVSREARRRWWLWCAVLVVTPLIGTGWQELVGRRRPHGSALGFPSGHATAVASFSVLAIYLVGQMRLAAPWRLGIQSLAVLTMVAVGLARIVLGAHWPADVVTGFALGSACAAAAAWWHLTHPASETVPSTGDCSVKRGLFGIVLIALLLAACSQVSGPPPKPLVVASFYPLYEFSRQVAGDRAEVVSLVPPDAEPHDWEPSPQDVVQLQKAKLFVYNGATALLLFAAASMWGRARGRVRRQEQA